MKTPDTNPVQGAAAPERLEAQAKDLVRAIGLVFSNAYLYGLQHPVTRQALDRCYEQVRTAANAWKEISLSLTDEAVMINTTTVARSHPLVQAFARPLAERDISNFVIDQGLSREQFDRLMETLNARPEELRQMGGLSKALEAAGVQNVRAWAVTYKRVTEHEAVVEREPDASAEEGARAAAVPVLDLLKQGGDPTPGTYTIQSVKKLSEDPGIMGETLVEAARLRQQADGGEDSLAFLVVDSLKRMVDLLAADKAFQTQTGRKNLIKILQALEGKVHERIREMAGSPGPEERDRLADGFEEVTDQLRMDSLVTEYLRKRNAIEKNEQRLLRFMKSKGLDKLSETELEQRLAEGGLTAQGWRALLVKSGLDAGQAAPEDVPIVGSLSELLRHIQARMSERDGDDPSSREELRKALLGVDREIKRLVKNTKVKIEALVQKTQKDLETADAIERKAEQEGRRIHLPRRQLLESLAEIAQELCQPLSVIHCSLFLLISGGGGRLSEKQTEVLNLARESADRLKILMHCLMDISGLPGTLAPARVPYGSKEKDDDGS